MSPQPEESQSVPPSIVKPIQPDSGRGGKGLWGTLVAGLLILGGKLKFLLAFLKFGWLGKYWLTAASMLVSVMAYATVQPLPFAIGFVLMILVHEIGHVLVLQHYGLRITAPVFIPFMGAAVGMKDMPLNAEQEAWMAAGGPFLGGVAALVAFWLYRGTQDPLYLHLASVGFWINLFNLTPFHPLDGGRMTGAISKWFMLVGLAIIGGILLSGNFHPVLLIILVLGIGRVFSLFRRTPEELQGYYDIPLSSRVTIGLAYFGMVAGWGWWGYHTSQMLR